MVAELLVEDPTLVSIDKHLLAIGGAVRMYNPDSNSWQKIGNLRTPRWSCFAVVLPNNRIMVVGGYNQQSMFTAIDNVDFAAFISK